MAYLVTKTRVASLTVNGADYTQNFTSWTVSDSSALTNGLVSTSGSLVLTGLLGGSLLQDYDRNNFRRGVEVILELAEPGGASYRHPRGLLYVVGDGYSVEDEAITIDIGCQIALATLTDQPSSILLYAPIELDPTQQTIQGVGGSLVAAGKYLYQDNTGSLQTASFFDGDTNEGTGQPSGEWVSILGKTALSVQPLQGSGAIPDSINLSYAQPVSFSGGDGGQVDETLTESYYFITYPAVVYQRTGNGLGSISGVYQGTVVDANFNSGCGNTPPPPQQSQQQPSCNDGYTLQPGPLILPAERTQLSRTEYYGPAGQVSRVYTQTNGPAIEANSQYFADSYAYCRHSWATQCQPNGACSTDEGMEQILLGYTEATNYYGTANELIKTVVDTYATTLSGAQPFNWRSGVVDGVPQSFQTLSLTDMYRVSRVITEYTVSGDANVQEATTYTSVTSRQVGINNGSIDALDGIRTFERRTSTTISTTPIAPDSTQSPQTRTTSLSTKIPVRRLGYTESPEQAGPYVMQAQAPVPFLLPTQEEVSSAVDIYSEYLRRSVLGDSYGLQIAESLRSEIVSNWRPGMPFRYWDNRPGTASDTLMAMRMDACVWGVGQDGAEVVTNGIWVGTSNGRITEPSNIVGTGAPIVAPEVIDETVVSTGSYAFYVNIEIPVHNTFKPLVENIVFLPPSESETVANYTTMTVWLTGFVVGPGSLVGVGPAGSAPLTNNGELVLADATGVIPDLFTGYTSNSGASFVSTTTTFVLTASGSTAYVFNGGGLLDESNPVLQLVRGNTYVFNNVSGSHPFEIQEANGSAYDDGVTNNNTIGVVTFTVPQTAPGILQYACTVHPAMTGAINVVNP